MNKFRNILIVLFAFIVVECKQEKTMVTNLQNENLVSNDIPNVEAIVIKKQKFKSEIISNGSLNALRKVDLVFGINEPITKINFANGEFVRKGDIIAELDNYNLKHLLEQARVGFESAELALADMLIGQGYSMEDTSSMPKEILRVDKIRSGYAQAKANLELSIYNYEQSSMESPINGILANMFSKELNNPVNDPFFCSVIDNSVFEVIFPIMETEISQVKKGQEIEVSPYYNPELIIQGYIKVVNPVVDENGMVKVYAIVNNKNNMLYQGMNVKIHVKRSVNNQLVVPKPAVTIRSDREVIFTLSNGYANWNYVEIGNENSDSYAINEGLNEGDTVIIKGNLHLGHLSKVNLTSVDLQSF